jgi:3-oxoacyl-[acyl-carrier protein] reductase
VRLKDKVAIVTGAASGIGEATAKLFAGEGAWVLAVDRPESTILDVHRDNPNISALAQDITGDGAPERIINEAVEQFGTVDILMNNAGVSGRTYVEDIPLEEWDRIFNVNVRAQFALCRLVLPIMKERGWGRIVNVASVMAERTDYGLAPYCASKAGVAGLTRTIALEYGKFGITANYILPGPIYTGMTRANFDQEYIREVWEKKTAVRRLGQPIDIARGALFLASDEAEYVTGIGLTIDGGLTLRT